jgi:hypothetical protein
VKKGVRGREHILLHDQDNVIPGLEGIVELNEVHVVQLVHDVDLILHFLLSRREHHVSR